MTWQTLSEWPRSVAIRAIHHTGRGCPCTGNMGPTGAPQRAHNGLTTGPQRAHSGLPASPQRAHNGPTAATVDTHTRDWRTFNHVTQGNEKDQRGNQTEAYLWTVVK